MGKINYNAGATLLLLGKPNGFHTLADAIRLVLKMSAEDRERACIAVGADAGTDETALRWRKIEELSRQPDFPKT
jgi:hypothetical protein